MSEFISSKPLETAVLFLIFNRLETTKKVFNEIRRAKPPRLFLASDGARDDRKSEYEVVESVRKYVLDNIDWDCEVKTLLRSSNLGCKYAVSGAITWFFEHEEQGIILEDDCLPSQSFFWYCEDLLNRYKSNNNIFMISGDNFQDGTQRGNASYYFSIFPHIWGWATWKRAWELYDVEFASNNILGDNLYPQLILQDNRYKQFWNNIYSLMKTVNTWDYQLSFSIFKNKMLCINPNVNLISNIGFGDEATHTKNINDINSRLLKREIINITHPTAVLQDADADLYSSNKFFSNPGLFRRMKNKLKSYQQ